MRRSYAISDWFYRLTHSVKRNRSAVVIYALITLLFLIIGIAVGVNIDDKTSYVLHNRSPIFAFLRGDSGVVSMFFVDLVTTAVYCLFTLSMFFKRPLSFLSLAPCMYMAYSLGMRTTVIIAVFSASALPLLFVFYVPVGIIEIIVVCILSYKCLAFAALNGRCSPSKPDIKAYYCSAIPFFFVVAVCTLVNAVTAALFGSALIGVV